MGRVGGPVVPEGGCQGEQPLGDAGEHAQWVRPPWRSRVRWP